MRVLQNKSLKDYNTFGIDVRAKKFISVNSFDELKNGLRKVYASELFILGGGSNMLLTKDLNKTVLHINLKGKEILKDSEDFVEVKAQAGENWHQFVLWCLDHDFGGLENLSLIPGNIGSAPIQNIGAYGVELKDRFISCEAMDVQTLETTVFSKEECRFGYRNSVFKGELKGQFIITSVTLKLSKKNHQLQTGYGAIQEELAGIEKPNIRSISNAVIKIRQEKLPDPKEIGNSGSFFKNPVISVEKFETIKKVHSEIPSYAIDNQQVKVPAGWLIERAGFKGFREGDAGVHKKQALVLVNYGNATGMEILNLAKKIKNKVNLDYGILLEFEVNVF